MIIFLCRNVRMQNIPNFVSIIGVGFDQILIIHDNIHELNNKTTYRIKYHTTLNTIWIVVYWNRGLFLQIRVYVC
jgi:hypothetical protein